MVVLFFILQYFQVLWVKKSGHESTASGSVKLANKINFIVNKNILDHC